MIFLNFCTNIQVKIEPSMDSFKIESLSPAKI